MSLIIIFILLIMLILLGLIVFEEIMNFNEEKQDGKKTTNNFNEIIDKEFEEIMNYTGETKAK